jgi:ribosomal protein S27AE
MIIFLENQSEVKILPRYVRAYLLEKAHNQCGRCGWGEMNIYSNTYPLILDHIDGNSENNKIKNLRVLCSNCDSLLPTYKGLNKGNGRHYRKVRYQKGKSF